MEQVTDADLRGRYKSKLPFWFSFPPLNGLQMNFNSCSTEGQVGSGGLEEVEQRS